MLLLRALPRDHRREQTRIFAVFTGLGHWGKWGGHRTAQGKMKEPWLTWRVEHRGKMGGSVMLGGEMGKQENPCAAVGGQG